MKEGAVVPADQTIKVKVGEDVKQYRRLLQGDKVDKGQIIARLEDRLARHDLANKEKKMLEAERASKKAEKDLDEVNKYWRGPCNSGTILESSQSPKLVQERRTMLLLWKKTTLEAKTTKEDYALARLEFEKARLLLEMHEIRSPVSGVIQAIHKHPGERVKTWETILEVVEE